MFGGVIRPQAGRLRLPDHLETDSATPAAARVFALFFSETANVDGLAFKALELAEALRDIRRFTGQRRIRIVAHSGGGLVVRALLQRSLPGLDDIPHVERVITVATPHLGCALAEHLGDFLGTRASSLKPTAGLIRRLNDDLELPPGTNWASIIVRGTSIGTTGIRQQEPLIVPLLRRDAPLQLPIDLLYGGDQVVDVRSQNLALSRCAERYERLTNRNVVTLVARVPDPTPADESPLEATVHELAPRHTATLDMIELLLRDDRVDSPWHPLQNRLPDWLTNQLRLHAASEVEWQAAQLHELSEVQRTDLIRCDIHHDGRHSATINFEGRAHSVGRLLRLNRHITHVRAIMRVTWTDSGRIDEIQTTVRRVHDE